MVYTSADIWIPLLSIGEVTSILLSQDVHTESKIQGRSFDSVTIHVIIHATAGFTLCVGLFYCEEKPNMCPLCIFVPGRVIYIQSIGCVLPST